MLEKTNLHTNSSEHKKDSNMFLEYASKKLQVSKQIQKGRHAGEMVKITSKKVGPSAVEYYGVVGDKLIAKMYLNPPIGGISKVTNSQVALEYQRSGVATMLYNEIEMDLKLFSSRLIPQWGSMSVDALRFWRRRRPQDLKLQILINRELAKRKNEIRDWDEDRSDHWNGEWIGEKRFENLLKDWIGAGYTQVIFDSEDYLIFPKTENTKMQDHYQIIDIAGNEELIVELIKKTS